MVFIVNTSCGYLRDELACSGVAPSDCSDSAVVRDTRDRSRKRPGSMGCEGRPRRREHYWDLCCSRLLRKTNLATPCEDNGACGMPAVRRRGGRHESRRRPGACRRGLESGQGIMSTETAVCGARCFDAGSTRAAGRLPPITAMRVASANKWVNAFKLKDETNDNLPSPS